MDIKIPSDLPAARASVAQTGDLLSQLKAAGTIEAEVVKLLQDNKLLLSSRLGDILASNKLNYKAGDRIYLRLDDSAQQPVLKTSPRPDRPVLLDSRQNPQLARALPPDRPVLAKVIKIVAQRAEIQLAEQILKLPRGIRTAKNQLLSLQRIDSRRGIEITPLDRKSIYKAILQQLIPRQAESEGSSLVRFLQLMTSAAARPRPAPAQRPETGQRHSPESSTKAAIADIKPGAKNIGTNAFEQVQAKAGDAHAQKTAASASPVAARDAGRAATDTSVFTRRLPTFDTANPARFTRQTASNAPAADPLTAPKGMSGDSTVPGKPGANQTITARDSELPAQTRLKNNRPLVANELAAAAKPANNARSLPLKNGDEPGSSTIVPASTSPLSAARATKPAPSAGANQPLQQTAPNMAPALQPLLQLITRFPEIDATQIKKWLEFARLIYPPKPEPGSAAPHDIFRVLRQFGNGESFSRELLQSAQHGPRAAADTDSSTVRTPAQEALLQQVREGVKLVEQSLSQNLLQRATLGLQQETQQPLSLNLALPFVDEQETRPLHIELAQRKRAQEEDNKSWDIRLSFELASLGPISCHLVLEGSSVAASFYSQLAQTRERIEAALPELRQQLSRAGFTPGEFHSFPGKPASKRTPAAADFSEALVDIEV